MAPHVELAATLTLVSPLLLWLACLTEITARTACMLGCLAIGTGYLRERGWVAGDAPVVARELQAWNVTSARRLS